MATERYLYTHVPTVVVQRIGKTNSPSQSIWLLILGCVIQRQLVNFELENSMEQILGNSLIEITYKLITSLRKTLIIDFESSKLR